jgi:hypothetical protein
VKQERVCFCGSETQIGPYQEKAKFPAVNENAGHLNHVGENALSSLDDQSEAIDSLFVHITVEICHQVATASLPAFSEPVVVYTEAGLGPASESQVRIGPDKVVLFETGFGPLKSADLT